MAGNSQIRSVVASAGLLLFVSRVLFSGDAFATYCDYYCEEKKKIVKRAGSAARNACNNAVRAIEAYTDCYEDPACVDEAAGVMIANAAVGAATLGLLAAGPPGAVVAAGATLITSVAAFVYEAWSYYDCVSYPDCDNEKQSMYNAIVGAENANNVLSLPNAELTYTGGYNTYDWYSKLLRASPRSGAREVLTCRLMSHFGGAIQSPRSSSTPRGSNVLEETFPHRLAWRRSKRCVHW